MNTEAQEIIDRIYKEHENAETNKAPSGEWAEYNIGYLKKEASAWAVEELVHAIGSCGECEHKGTSNCVLYWAYDGDEIPIERFDDFYCADFKRKNDGISS